MTADLCGICNGVVEYSDEARANVCTECGVVVNTALVSSEFCTSSVRRVAALVGGDDEAFERQIGKFCDAAVRTAHLMGCTTVAHAEMELLARKALRGYTTRPRGRSLFLAGAAAALLRSRRMGCFVSMQASAALAGVTLGELANGYRLLLNALGDVAPPLCSVADHLSAFRELSEKLLDAALSSSWTAVSAATHTVLRIMNALWSVVGRAPTVVAAIAVAFAIRYVACERLLPTVPSAAKCLATFSVLTTSTKKSLMEAYQELSDAIARLLEDDDEVHARIDEVHDKLWTIGDDGEWQRRDIQSEICSVRKRRANVHCMGWAQKYRRLLADSNVLSDEEVAD